MSGEVTNDEGGRDVVVYRDDSQKVTARGLIVEAKRIFATYERFVWQKAILNERFIAGQQFIGINIERNEIVDEWPSLLPRINRNVLRNQHLTWQARVTRKDPSVKAWGGESSQSDVQAADVANKLIGAWRQQQDHRRTISRAAWTTATQGTSAFWVFWDASRGAKDSAGEPIGDVVVKPLQVFDWGTDGSEFIEDSEYCFVRQYITKQQAKSFFKRKHIKEEPAETQAMTIWGETRPQVECIYYYHKPCDKIPKGFYCIQVSGQIVESGDYPYAHGKLPLIIWKCVDKPDSPHGATHIDDAVPLQGALNRLHAAQASMTVRCATWLKVIGAKEIVEVWDTGEQFIQCADPEKIAAVRIVNVPPPSALLQVQMTEVERMIGVIFGQNEAIVGSDASASKNARHLEYINELDAQKLAPTLVMRDHALVEMYRQMLELFKQFATAQRTIQIIGPTGAPALLSFSAADLQGVDVYLEPAPGVDDTKTATAQAAEIDAAAGFMPLDQANEQRRTGQTMSSMASFTRELVAMQASQALQGYGVVADESVDPAVAVQAIQEQMIQHSALGEERLAPLMELAQAYQALAQPPVEQEQPQQQAAPKKTPDQLQQKDIFNA